MASFELFYDEEEDVLEATFTSFDEQFARSIPLNDNIVLYADLSLTAGWGITIYSYGTLLQVNETHMDGISRLAEDDQRRLLRLLALPPTSLFLEVLEPLELRAIVKAPALSSLLRS